MREYRGKRIDNGEWVYGFGVDEYETIGGDTKAILYTNQEEYMCINKYEVYPETVGQYIGVHDDEEDNQIFEGDSIRMVYQEEKITGNIQYCGGGFLLASDDFEDGYMWISELTENDGGHFWIPTAEIIGNSWDHPYLLGEDSK